MDRDTCLELLGAMFLIATGFILVVGVVAFFCR